MYESYTQSGGYQDPYLQNKALTSQMGVQAPSTGFAGGTPIKTSGTQNTAYTPPAGGYAPATSPSTNAALPGMGGGGGAYQPTQPTGGGGWSAFDKMFPGSTLTPQQLAANEAQLAQAGFRLLGPNSAGQRTKVEYQGHTYDVIGGASSGQNIKQRINDGITGSGTASPGGLTTFKMPKPTVAPHQGQMNSLLTQLMGRAKQGTNIDTGSANFRQQSDAFAAGQERSRRNSIADNAEAKSAQLLAGSGAERSSDRLINERAAQATGGFEAQLVGSELMNRRQEIQSALSQMGGLLDNEQQRTLQKTLADIDAQLRMAGINSSEKMANNSLGFNYTQLENQANQAALRAMLGGGY
jgi:hypothetical protein